MFRSSFFLIVGALAVTVSTPAFSTIYYIDSRDGNDAWAGDVSSPGSGNGPWQSLFKVSTKSLMPGDSVLLKCGGIWNETLVIPSSGTAANPISIGAYPSACTNKPIINGSTPIPGQNWVKDTGNVYKLGTTIDLITYGSFEKGLGTWGNWSPQHNATMNLTTTCAQAGSTCVSFTAGSGNSLIISNNFTVQGRQAYTASFAVKVPSGVSVWATVRRSAPPWEAVGLAKSITGTGTWQTVTLPFTATASLASARLDFGVPAGKNMGLDNVKITATLPAVLGVFDNGKTINVAHHPNRGHDPLRPDSLYFSVAENSGTTSLTGGGTGSSYLTTGADFAASAHSAVTSGTGIRVRPNAWTLNDRKIATVSGSRLTFDSPTTHPIRKGWGYFLYGQRWMLDEPGEWHYDATTKALYVWMTDSLAPGNRVSVGQRAIGVEASNRSHIRIKDLSIQNVETGIRMKRAVNIVLYNMNISDTLGMGVDASGSTDSGIDSSQIARTTGNAINAAYLGGSRFRAFDNLITDSGVSIKNGVITSLPVMTHAAIRMAEDSADIRENRIYGAGSVGIYALSNSLISGNHIENTCLVLDDCGAIYIHGQNNNNTIANNTVLHVAGGLPGKPANIPSQAQGIYLDELTSGSTISGNTVVDADNGIQIHNSANNRIENNTLYNNRRHHIWLQEGSQKLDPEGDLHSNEIIGNRLFLTSATPAIRQETILPKTNTDRFSSYDGNLYFTYLWPTISSESWPNGSALYTLPKWQGATSSGLPRNLDPTASEVNSASLGYALFRVLGGNIVPNGNLSSGKTGWGYWNQTAPYGQVALEVCAPTIQCLRYTAGSTESLLNSPNFSVQQGQWYKISFDLKTGINNQAIYVVTRRGGGGTNGYEALMSPASKVTGSTNLQRYSFLFKAAKTVNAGDPVTLDKGARVDFYGLMPGQNVSVANLQIVPLSAVDATLRSHILINPTGATLDLNCPDGSNALLCSEYVRFSDSQSVSWPYAVPPHESEIIYSRDSSLTDGDGDGISDYQDTCQATPAMQAVNATGCALGQI